ncbi:MAG: phosphopentomutase [Nitrospirae bacterium]|nr:phosphopentomutase [Nitrospirota bacterium]
MNRIILIVIDGLGIGELPDAMEYGDSGSNTLRNISEAVGGLRLPNMESLGLGFLGDFKGVQRTEKLIGSYGIMAEASHAKDSTAGHWEMMGIVTEKPFPTYPHGFPAEIIEAFEKAIGRKVLGNKPASGTEIIKELGSLHLETGCPIVYTSADSVFQIAAHEEIIPLDELYRMCETARSILKPPHNVGRVIARPFVGKEGFFVRTPMRKDFSIPPPEKTALQYLSESGLEVISIGKVKDIFAGMGFTKALSVSGNDDAIAKAVTQFKSLDKGVVWLTLVDLDTLYGHRNDPQGYARALENFDSALTGIFALLTENDMLIITADHGCDPTTQSTDHSREYVPLLIYGPSIKEGIDLGLRKSFSDIGATMLDAFDIKSNINGESFWKLIA